MFHTKWHMTCMILFKKKKKKNIYIYIHMYIYIYTHIHTHTHTHTHTYTALESCQCSNNTVFNLLNMKVYLVGSGDA